MADIETKQIPKQIKQDDPLPLLSLKPSKEDKGKKADNPESEKLWTRSLEFFEQIKAVSNI